MEKQLGRILDGKYSWPKDKSIRPGKNLKDLVARLLTVDASQRLGAYGVQDVMNHPWLSNIDWRKIATRQYCVGHPQSLLGVYPTYSRLLVLFSVQFHSQSRI